MGQLNEWHDDYSIRQLVFLPGQLKDTTQAARNLLKNRPEVLEEQYYSQPVQVYRKIDGSWCELPALYLRGVRVLFQDPLPTPAYGRTWVRLAVSSSAIRSIVASLSGTAGVTFCEEQVQDERVVSLHGVKYTIFTTHLGPKCPTRTVRDGEWVDFSTRDILDGQRTDILASVTFKLDLKYRGPWVSTPGKAPMSLKLTATSVPASDLTAAPLDPHPPVVDSSPPLSTASPEIQPTAAFLIALR